MNALQKFIAGCECGFVTAAQMPELIALDRLCPLLVRCGGCRFTAGAQYIAHLIKCIEAGGDYVRDVSFPVGSMERAASWRAEVPATFIREHKSTAGSAGPETMNAAAKQADKPKAKVPGNPSNVWFNEGDCGGVFDGFRVTSDADPGL